MSHNKFCLAPALWLAACASIPPDRGLSDVQQSLAARGQRWPTTAISERDAATARLLAQPLRLEDAISVALLNNPRVDIAHAQLGLAGADVLQAGRLSNPRLNASLGLPLIDHAVDRFSFGLAEDFLQLLLLPARSRLARADFERAKAEAGVAVLDLAADVANAYYICVAGEQSARLRVATMDAANISADYAKALAQAGNLDTLSLLLQNASAAQFEADALDAQARSDNARHALNRAMGLGSPSADHWHVAAGLQLPVAQEDDASALLKLAEANRLDLQAAQLHLAALRNASGIAGINAVLAGTEVGADYQRDGDGIRSIGPSANINLPLFDQGQAAHLRAEAGIELAQAQMDALRLDIDSQIQVAADRVVSAHQRVALIREHLLPLRAAAVAATQQRVNYALLGVFEVLDAKQQQYSAQARYLDALGEYWQARVALAHAVGTQLPSDAQIAHGAVNVSEQAAVIPDSQSAGELP